jgi:hypothetical protein
LSSEVLNYLHLKDGVAQDMPKDPIVCGANDGIQLESFPYNVDAVGTPDGTISNATFVMVVVEELNYATAVASIWTRIAKLNSAKTT